MEEYNLEHISRLGFPTSLRQGEATIDDIAYHAILRQRLHPNTVKKRMTQLRYMINHPVPINIEHPTFENWIKHIDYREQIENAGACAIQNEWHTIRMVLKAYGIEIWPYKPPGRPRKKAKKLPLPDTVRKMIQYPYTENKELNRHLQYLILHTFMLGLRNPSETCELKLNDVDLKKGTIIITEPKKYGNTREIAPEPQIMTGKNCKSLKYWIDNIRPKYENQHSKNYLYITLSGTPFSKPYLRKYLSKHIKPHFPEYHPYISRHWAATAKLIEEYIENKHWNRNRVQNWLGHDKETTTNTYISQAETYLRLAPYNWFKRVLNKPRK